jgi:putative acetyltransferase
MLTDEKSASRAALLLQADTAEQYGAARSLIEQYAAELNTASGVDLSFQNLSVELDDLRSIYGPPSGCLLLAGRGAQWIGCAALRRVRGEVCEMKRLYVQPRWRGAHVARRLADELVARARVLGYQRMVLDTLEEMTAVQTLYGSLGFRRTEPYYFNPLPGAVYMELHLQTSRAAR